MGKARFFSNIQKGFICSANTTADATGLPQSASLEVNVEVKLKNLAPIAQKFKISGLSEVSGIQSSQIIRTMPSNGSISFSPAYFPLIEFKDPYLPWSFSMSAANAQGKLCPWLCLIALPQEDADYKFDKKTMILKINSRAGFWLPKLSEYHAWAHVQEVIGTETNPSLVERIKASPDNFLSRLMCPIKLSPGMRYDVFLVPSFEINRKAILGLDTTKDTSMSYAWSESTEAIALPIFHSFSFQSSQSDFEEMARKLGPCPPMKNNGVVGLDLSEAGLGLSASALGYQNQPLVAATVYRGALSPVGANSTSNWNTDHKTKFENALDKLLLQTTRQSAVASIVATTATRASTVSTVAIRSEKYDALVNDPPLTSQLYGYLQTGFKAAYVRKDFPTWMTELNYDPSLRVAANLGAEVVKKNQEEYMAKSWEQARNAKETTQQLRKFRMALGVNERIEKRLKALSDSTFIRLTAISHKKQISTSLNKTMAQVYKDSRYAPTGLFDQSAKRVAVKASKLNKSITGFSVMKKISNVVLMASPIVQKLALPRPFVNLGIEKSYELKTTAASRISIPGISTPATADESISPDFNMQKTLSESRSSISTRGFLKKSLSLGKSFFSYNENSIVPIAKKSEIQIDLSEPSFDRLVAIGMEYIIPGFKDIPAESILLVAENRKFIESFLIGMNHEMAKEFAWRQFPTSIKNSWFHQFWNYIDSTSQKDMSLINTWPASSKLGDHKSTTSVMAAMSLIIINSKILKEFPSCSLFLVKAKWQKKTPTSQEIIRVADLSVATNILKPIIQGALGDEASYVGFSVSQDQLIGNANPSKLSPGWFFAIEEKQGSFCFGVDLAEDYTMKTKNPISAANFAKERFQMPVRLLIHCEQMLLGDKK